MSYHVLLLSSLRSAGIFKSPREQVNSKYDRLLKFAGALYRTLLIFMPLAPLRHRLAFRRASQDGAPRGRFF
jgi:hypothetical protein